MQARLSQGKVELTSSFFFPVLGLLIDKNSLLPQRPRCPHSRIPVS